MKIKKITESALVEGNIQVNDTFQLIFEKDDTGIELDTTEIYDLHNLITDVLYPGLSFSLATPIQYDEAQEEESPDYIESPVVSKSMGVDLEPEVICENGACRLILPDEEPEEDQEPEPKPAKKEKKPSKKTKRDYTKYINMRDEGVEAKEIQREMINDLGISNMTAENYYYAYVSKAAVPPVEKEKKKPLKAIEHRTNEKKKKLSPLEEDISYMPTYPNVQEFKDACAAADVGRGKISVGKLKEMYLETHPEVRW